jgi:hypothetical protein
MKLPTEQSLKVAVTKAKNKAKAANTLDEKIELGKYIKIAEKRLHNFKLNYFEIEDLKRELADYLECEEDMITGNLEDQFANLMEVEKLENKIKKLIHG